MVSDCDLSYYQPANLSACGEPFIPTYNWFSFVHGTFFAIILLFSLFSFANRLIKSNMKIKGRDLTFKINILVICSSILGMIQCFNLYGFKWNLGCETSKCSQDLLTSLLYIICIQSIESTELGLIVQGLQETNDERRGSIRIYFPLFLQFIFFLSGLVPNIVYCSASDNVTKNNSLVMMYFSFALFGTSFFIFKFLSFAFQINKKMKKDNVKSINSIQPSTIIVMMNQSKEERQNFKSLYRKFVLYSILGFSAFAYQMYQGFAIFNSDTTPTTANPNTIFLPYNNIFMYFQMILLAILAYNNNVSSNRKETSKLGNAISYALTVNLWLFFFGGMTCVVFNDVEVYIAMPIFFLFLILCFILLVGNTGVNSRDQELLASINFIEGKVLNWRNVMFMFMEVATLSFVSLDSLYLWWSPSWFKEWASVLFNGVSSSDSDYLEYLLPHVSSRIITNSLIGYIFVLIIITTSSAFLRLPKLILRFSNFLSYFTFDIFIMTISSLLLRRLKCHDPLQGKIKDNDSLIGTGYLIGYNYILCDNSEFLYVYTFLSLIGIIGLLVGYGLIYFLLVRNKTALPNVWDVPGFTGLKMLMKFIIVCGINLTPKDYVFSPWIRATINLFCVMSITFTSFVMMPCLGPQAEFINLYRTSAYSFAFFCSLMSFISLILLSTCGLENEMAGNIMSISTLAVPILGSLMVFYISRRRKHHKLDAIKRVCELAISNGTTIESILIEYEESIRLYGKNGNPFSFLPALTLHYSSDTLMVISSALQSRMDYFDCLSPLDLNINPSTNPFLSSLSYPEQDHFILEGIPSAFSFLEKASQYPEGSQVIKRKFLPQLVNCFMSCDRYYSVFDFNSIIIDTKSKIRSLTHVDIVLIPLLEAIVISLCKVVVSICERSKYYVHEISISYPSLIVQILKLRNFNTFILENEFYDILKPQKTEVLKSSIVLFDNLLNIFHYDHHTNESESLLISLIVNKGNDLDIVKMNDLKKNLGKLIKVEEESEIEFNVARKLKNQDRRKVEDEFVSSDRINSKLVDRIASGVRFGANRVFSKRMEGSNKSNRSLTFSEKFALCDRKIFLESTLENDALLILNINPKEITKTSIIGIVEDIFGPMKAEKRKRLTETISFQVSRIARPSRTPRVSKLDTFIKEILNKRKKENSVVVIAVCAVSADSKPHFHSHIEKVKQEFMEEWRKEDNPLKGSIEIVLEIEGLSKEQEEEMFGLNNNGLFISQHLIDYVSNLTGKVKKIMKERKRKKDFWAVYGIEV